MMIKLTLSEEAVSLGLNNAVVGVITQISNVNTDCTLLTDRINAEYGSIKENREEILKRSESIGFRVLLDNLGCAGTIPAGERLLSSFCEKGFKRYNNLIDAYNIVSMKYCAGIGMHNYSGASNELRICLSDGNQKIVPIFKSKEYIIEKGQLIYMLDNIVMAWLGKKDTDSDLFRVTDKSVSVIVVVLGNVNTSREFNINIIREIYDSIVLFSPNVILEVIESNDLD